MGTNSIFALIKELAEYEGQGQDVIRGRLPFQNPGNLGSGDGVCKPFVHFLVAVTHDSTGNTSSVDQVVGLVAFIPCYASWSGRRLRLECLVVPERLRGQGVGSQLM